jgi:hypothetical protein
LNDNFFQIEKSDGKSLMFFFQKRYCTVAAVEDLNFGSKAMFCKYAAAGLFFSFCSLLLGLIFLLLKS